MVPAAAAVVTCRRTGFTRFLPKQPSDGARKIGPEVVRKALAGFLLRRRQLNALRRTRARVAPRARLDVAKLAARWRRRQRRGKP